MCRNRPRRYANELRCDFGALRSPARIKERRSNLSISRRLKRFFTPVSPNGACPASLREPLTSVPSQTVPTPIPRCTPIAICTYIDMNIDAVMSQLPNAAHAKRQTPPPPFPLHRPWRPHQPTGRAQPGPQPAPRPRPARRAAPTNTKALLQTCTHGQMPCTRRYAKGDRLPDFTQRTSQ